MKDARAKRALWNNLCEEAMPEIRRGAKPNAVACAECDSLCIYGLRLLSGIDDEAFSQLLCGSDCETCRQPCSLRNAALMRKRNGECK